eukprot:6214155-Pleurochrysis_carterae.AAC.5
MKTGTQPHVDKLRTLSCSATSYLRGEAQEPSKLAPRVAEGISPRHRPTPRRLLRLPVGHQLAHYSPIQRPHHWYVCVANHALKSALSSAAGGHAVPAAIHRHASTRPSTDHSLALQLPIPPLPLNRPPTITQPTASTPGPPFRRLHSTGHVPDPRGLLATVMHVNAVDDNHLPLARIDDGMLLCLHTTAAKASDALPSPKNYKDIYGRPEAEERRAACIEEFR